MMPLVFLLLLTGQMAMTTSATNSTTGSATTVTVNPTSSSLTMTSVSVPSSPVTSPPVSVPSSPVTSPPVSVPSSPVTSPPVSVPSSPVTSPPVSVPSSPVTSPPVSVPSSPVTSPPVSVPSSPVTSPPVSVTSSPTASADSRVNLAFKLEQIFTPELSNTSSPEFRNLADIVKAVLDLVYRRTFGLRFICSVIRSFRRGSVLVDADLVFNNASSVPNISAVADTLVEAATNNPNFSLPVNVSTIVVTPITTSTSVPTSALPTPATTTAEATEITTATATEITTATATEITTATATEITTAVSPVTSSPVSVTSSPVTSSPVSVTSSPVTSPPVSVTSSPTASADSRVNLAFKLEQIFTPELSNTSSPEFRNLANAVTAGLDLVYRSAFGPSFIRSVIRSFSQGSVKVDADLVFNNASSVPDTSAVANTLVEAATNNPNFSLPVNVSTIVVTPITTSTSVPTSAPPTPATTTATATEIPTAVSPVTSSPVSVTSSPVTSSPVSVTSSPVTSSPVSVTSSPVTSPPVSVTSSPTASADSRVNLAFKLEQIFTPELSNTSSPEFRNLANALTAGLDLVYRGRFGPSFSRSVIRSFSQGSVKVDADLVFNNASSVPNISAVANTLVEAATNNPNFSLPVNVSTIAVTPITTSTSVPTSAPPTPATTTATATEITTAVSPVTSSPVNVTSSPVSVTSPPVTSPPSTTASADSRVNLAFKLEQTFTSALSNSSSQEFRDLADAVTAVLDLVYRGRFGRSFIRSVIRSFSRGSVNVDADLVFKNASSVPEPSTVADALVEAATNNSNFSLPVNVSTIAVTPITTSTSVPTSAPPTPATTTAEATEITTATATEITTAVSTDPPSATEGTLGLLFRLNQIFTSDLSNPSSTAYQTLARKVITEINRVSRNAFGSPFLRSILNAFTNGSVAVNMTLVFQDSNSVPSESNATSALSSGLGNSTVLSVIPGSVSTQSTSTSSSAPRLVLGSLGFFSVTLLAVAQILINL